MPVGRYIVFLLGQFCVRWREYPKTKGSCFYVGCISTQRYYLCCITVQYNTIPVLCVCMEINTFCKHFSSTSLRLRGKERVLLEPSCGPSNILRGYPVYQNVQHLLCQRRATMILFRKSVMFLHRNMSFWGLFVVHTMSR